MLQGDLNDWTALATTEQWKGHATTLARRMRRNGRDTQGDGATSYKEGEPYIKEAVGGAKSFQVKDYMPLAEVKGDLKMGPKGPVVIPVEQQAENQVL